MVLNNQTSSLNYSPYLYPQHRTKSNVPVDLIHLQGKISIDDRECAPACCDAIPTLTPTAEEFANPIQYIESISELGRRFGAVKIRPPVAAMVPGTSSKDATTIGSQNPVVPPNLAAPVPRHPISLASATAQDSVSFVDNFQVNADTFWLQTNRLLNNPPTEELESRLQFHQDLTKFHLYHASDCDTERSSPIPSPITDEKSQANIIVASIKEQTPLHQPKADPSSEHATLEMMAKSNIKHEDLGILTVEPVFKQSPLSTSDMAVTACNFEASSAFKAIANSQGQTTKAASLTDSRVPEEKPTVDALKVKKQLPLFLNKFPMIDKRPLDLYKLFRSVQMRGGFIEVITKKLWAQIGRELGYRGKIMTSLSSSLKSSYLKILYPFEKYLASMNSDEVQSPDRNEEPASKKRKSTTSPLIIGSAKTFKRAMKLKMDKGFLLNRPHASEMKQPNILTIKKVAAEVAPPDLEVLSSDSSTPSASDNTKKRGHKALSQNQTNRVPITPRAQLVHSLGALVETLHIQDCLPATANGKFSSVYTLRQFMEKDAKFQEYLINRYSTSFKKISQSTVTDTALEATNTFDYPCRIRQLKDEPVDKSSLIPLEKCAISVDKFEQMYWSFITNTYEPPSVNKLQSLQEGPELENGVSLPSTIHGSGFSRLGDDLANFKSTVYNSNTFANQTALNSNSPQGRCVPDATSSSDIKQLKCEESSAKSVRSSLTPWNLHNLSVLPNSLLGALGESDVNNQDMYIPALNIGMTFSTENWHTEDHFTQLCNYQFFGGPKRWYFIPPLEFDKFEKMVVERTNEELKVHINNKSWDFDSIMSHFNVGDFEGLEANKINIENETLFSSLENMIPPYPDYNNERLELSHSQFQRMMDHQRSKRNPQSGCVTSLNQDCFISPSTLSEAGIKYTYAIQNPGEFIIKFPKTYSASISLGLNLSEEVNFATASWLDFALEGEKWINKQLLLPNFLLFKMLVNLAQLHESARHYVYFDSDVYQKALQQYAEISEAEIKLRDNVRAVLQATKREVVLEEKSYSDGHASIADDDLQNLYPSRIVLTDMLTLQSMYISLTNFLEYNGQDDSLFEGLKVELQVFCSDDKLRHYGKVLSSYSIDYGKWLSRVEELLQENKLLPLKSLKSLLSDGEKIHSATAAAFFTKTQEKSDPLYLTFERELANLKTFVYDANQFVEECQQILSLKHQQRIRGGGSRRGKSLEIEATVARRNHDSASVLQTLIRLINKIPMLNFACAEADQILDLQIEIENFERASRSFLVSVSHTAASLTEYDDLISLGESFGLDLPSLSYLVRLRDRLIWLEQYEVLSGGGDPFSKKGVIRSDLDDFSEFCKRGLTLLGAADSHKYKDAISLLEKSKAFDTRVAQYLARELLDTLNLAELEEILNEFDNQALLLESKTQVQLFKIKQYSDIIAKYQEFMQKLSDPKDPKAPAENSSYTLQDIAQLLSILQESGLKFDEKKLLEEIQRAQEWSAEVASELHKARFRSTAQAPSKPNLSATIAFFGNKNKYSFAIDDNYMLSSSRLLYEEEHGQGIQAHDYRQIYCICREHEAGTMIECDTCKEWYHVQCIQEDDDGHFVAPENYLCPLCAVVSTSDFDDWMTRNKITVGRLQELVTQGNAILVAPNELSKLMQLLQDSEYAAQWMTEAITEIKVSQDSIKVKIDKMRFYLRKSYGASVLLLNLFHDTLVEIRQLLAVSDESEGGSTCTPTEISLVPALIEPKDLKPVDCTASVSESHQLNPVHLLKG